MSNRVSKRVLLLCFYDRICLSIRSLSAMLQARGHHVSLIFFKEDSIKAIPALRDDNVQYQMLWKNSYWGCGYDINPVTKQDWGLLEGLVADIGPDVVGVSTRSVHDFLAREAARRIRRIAPRARFLAGGFGPTLRPLDFLPDFDFVCIGEGDNMIVQFVESDTPENAPNLVCLRDGKLAWNPILPPAQLDQLPYVDWDEGDKYMVENGTIRTGYTFLDPLTYDVFASRGCPAACTYCMACQWGTMLSKYGKKFPKTRLRTPQNLVSELVAAKERYGITYVRFRDDIFGLTERWVTEFMDLYDKQVGLGFHCILDERFATEPILRRLVTSGLSSTTFGIQSAHEGIRRNILNRQISNERILAYLDAVGRAGIKSLRYDIIGWNPFETEETLAEGLNFLKQFPKSEDTKVGQLKVFPGSPIGRLYEQRKPRPLSSADYAFWARIFVMTLTSEETATAADRLLRAADCDETRMTQAFAESMNACHQKLKLMLVTDRNSGDPIMSTHVNVVRSDRGDIAGNQLQDILGLKLARRLPKGHILHWEDIQHSYQNVSTVKAGN